MASDGAEQHRGAFLSMNVSGPSAPSFETAKYAILSAHDNAVASSTSGTCPTAILLQEYNWADKSLRTLLSELTSRSGGAQWDAERQWKGNGQRDAVVVYNTAIYQAVLLTTSDYMQQASEERLDGLLGPNLPAATAEKIKSYATRWAGVHLAATNPATGEPSLQFLLVSYHGREKRRQSNGTTNVTRIQEPIKTALAREFVSEVARAAAHATFHFGIPDGATSRYVPALIAGDWNIGIDALANLTSLEEHGGWQCDVREPRRPYPLTSVRVDEDGLFKGHIDYVVGLNHAHDHALACDVWLTDVQALPHSASHRAFFDHDPLLIEFSVKARHVAGEVEELRPRAAAVEARQKIRKLSGKLMRQQALSRPTSFGIAAEEEEPEREATAGVSNRVVVSKGVEKLMLPMLARCPAKYELTKGSEEYTLAQLKKAVKAMALDALGVPNQRGKRITDYAAAATQSWWPSSAKKIGDFDAMEEKIRKELYAELQKVLLGVQVATQRSQQPTPPPTGGIASARGLMERLRKSFSLQHNAEH